MKSKATTHVGSIIRKLRRRNEYSQEYLAHKLHMSQNNVSKMERNMAPVTYNQLCVLAKVFEVNPSVFFENNIRK